MKKPQPADRSRNVRTPVITALIGALSTVLVAWIGVIPSLRQQDQAEIRKLKGDIDSLKDDMKKFTGIQDLSSIWVVRGSVLTRTEGGTAPMGNALVALLPTASRLLQQTDDQGAFVFSQVPTGHYILLVAAPDTRISGRGLIEAAAETNDHKDLSAAVVNYRIEGK